jgi:hypothetical protein
MTAMQRAYPSNEDLDIQKPVIYIGFPPETAPLRDAD